VRQGAGKHRLVRRRESAATQRPSERDAALGLAKGVEESVAHGRKPVADSIFEPRAGQPRQHGDPGADDQRMRRAPMRERFIPGRYPNGAKEEVSIGEGRDHRSGQHTAHAPAARFMGWGKAPCDRGTDRNVADGRH